MKLLLKLALCLACVLTLTHSSFAQVLPPQGRLTLVSNTPVMTSDVVGATTIYYTPYIGNSLVVSNGTSLSNQTFSQLSLNISTVEEFGQVADLYAIYVSGTFHLCVAGNWSNSTTRGSSLALTTLQGIWVNANTVNSCDTATNEYSVPANEGIYLGSMYTSETPSSSTLGLTVQLKPAAAAGGTNNLIGLFNAYNRVRVESIEADSTSSWTYTGSSARPANYGYGTGANGNNRINFLDGLGVVYTSARYTCLLYPSSQGVGVGVGFNESFSIEGVWGVENSIAAVQFNSEEGKLNAYPSLGMNYFQAMEGANNTNTATFYGVLNNFPTMGLVVDTEY